MAMGKRDKRIDLYIANSAPFAQPILKHLREIVHTGCPNVEETMKWSFPHFEYHNEILCSMAAFKKHCSFGFWKASIMPDPDHILQLVGKTAMGSIGQLTNVDDLPRDRILIRYLKAAAKLNEEGAKAAAKAKATAKKQLEVPEYFMKALSKNNKALKTFEGFSNTNKKEYVTWVTEAKTEETRAKRIETAVEWMAEGKIRNWKYVRREA
jgi:uncharacterized protein YdeI (YjbR/CyaY-like superfamily)